MTFAETVIRRPVLTIVVSVVMVLFGAVGFYFLGVREYPAVDPPVVTVTTRYTGAAPDVVDAQLTEPIEQAVSGIAGIRNISSTSSEGQSTVRIEFDLSLDMEAAANDVRDKVSGVVRQLPADTDPPVVAKADDSDVIVFLTVRSETKDILEVSNVANTMIKERVQTIPGVASVRIFGEKRYAMRLWLDAEKMAAHRVAPADVQRALTAQNVDLPSGRIEGQSTELSVRTVAGLSTPEQFERITIRTDGARPVLLGDVGRAELGPQETRFGVKTGGQRMIGVAIIPQPNTNAIEIADEFYRRLDVIRREIPPDYEIEIGYDFTKYVRRSVHEVQETLVLAFILVALIIYAFLRDWRSSLVPIIAIPVSIISTFFLVWALGFSINVLTLVGVVLSIGLVCDDAIVVLENIYSKVEEGVPPLRAAIMGSSEIFFAIISTTVTLAVVFLPIIFLQGLTGRLFREFAVVVVGSVLISGVVALTLSPMMCRYLLRKEQGFFYRLTEPFFRGLTRFYGWSLGLALRARWLALPALVAVLYLTVTTYKKLPTELAPLEDRSNVRINVRGPEGTTAEYTEHQLDQIDQWVKDTVPETSRTYSILGGFGGTGGVNQGVQNIYLVDADQRTRTQQDIFQVVSKGVGQFSGVRAVPSQPPTIGDRRGGLPVAYVLQAPNMDELVAILPKFVEAAQKRPELKFVDTDLKVNRPELAYEIDRERADALGVSAMDVARTMQLGLGGVRYGYFIRDGKQYQVMGQLREVDRDDPTDVKKLFVRNTRGDMVPLDSVVRAKEGASAAALYRYDRYVSATVSAGLADGYTLGDGIKAMDVVAADVLPERFRTSLSGQSRDYADSSSSTLLAFLFALVLVYLVLAAQFESFLDPVIILVTVPLSICGALLSLRLFDQTLNVFSQIGIIMLVGLVTKNGILVVEFANQRKRAGRDPLTAAHEAAVARFRPILMTSLATVLGVLPIALSLGGAAGSRRSLGIAVAGGLTFSLVLTLVLVPAIYAILSRRVAPRTEDAADVGPMHAAAE